MKRHVALERSALPSGSTLITLRGDRPGPTLALLGGVHGDEDEGVLATHLVLQRVRQIPLAGTLLAVAPASAPAWAAQSRTSPLDGGNLARSFPGGRSAGPTSTVAAAIAEQVIAGASLLIDLHSAGVRYRMPLMAGFARDSDSADASRRAALAFGAPLVWEHPVSSPGRSLFAARERAIPAIYAECAGGGSIRNGDLNAYVAGVLSVMADLGMAPASLLLRASEQRFVYGDGNLDAGISTAQSGLFVTSARVGEVVDREQEIGRLYDYEGNHLQEIHAPRRGMLMLLRRQARVQAGDVLFSMARLDDVAA